MVARAPGETPSIDQGVFLVHLIRARKTLREGRLDAASQELENAQMLRPEDEDVLNLLSILEFKRGHFLEAAQVARVLLKKNPDSAILHTNLGLILFKAGVVDEAERELSRAIEIKPDHARSHLYLGLLYRNRGKLGLALEHLRVAGAKKLAAELEEALRRGLRGAGAVEPIAVQAQRPSASGPPPFLPATEMEPAMEPPARSALRLAEPAEAAQIPVAPPISDEPADAPPETAPGQAEEPARAEAEPPVSAEVWTDEIAAERPAEAHPLFVVRADGALEIASPGVVYVRKGCVVWYSGNVRFTAEQAFRGTRLESILRADGRGYLFVNDPGRHAFRRDLSGQSLSLEGSRLLALDHGLSFRLEPIHDFRMNRRVDILRIQGQGSVILSVTGPLLAHEVSAEFPLIVSAHDLVAWSGNLLPAVLEDRFLEEVMQPDSAAAPKIKFEGEGTVLTEPPRPRRRSTDRGAGAADRRRT
jgi:tetratricopeptide (TPR) repeat protein/uncharacterized protein (AIM24 family)